MGARKSGARDMIAILSGFHRHRVLAAALVHLRDLPRSCISLSGEGKWAAILFPARAVLPCWCFFNFRGDFHMSAIAGILLRCGDVGRDHQAHPGKQGSGRASGGLAETDSGTET